MYPPTGRRRWLLAAAAGAVVGPGTGRAQALAAAPPLLLGVLPHVSARQLASQYQPMRGFLEGRLARPVQVVTAPDFAAFQARAAEGLYDLYITAANLGALALADGQAHCLGVFEPGIPALAVAPRERPQADAVAALRGRRLALANPASLVALRGMAWLHTQGLDEGRDYQLAAAPNEDSLARHLDSGDAPLALMSRGELNQLGAARRQTLEVVQTFATITGFMVMVPAQPRATDAAGLLPALRAFFTSPALAAFSTATGVRALRPLARSDLAQLDPLLDSTRRRLAALR